MAQEVCGDNASETRLRPAGIFCCEPEVFKHIPDTGYVDLKEQLIPALQRAGQRVGAVRLRSQSQQVTDWSSYLHAITRALSQGPVGEYRQLAPAIWVGRDVEIAADARIVGPAFIDQGPLSSVFSTTRPVVNVVAWGRLVWIEHDYSPAPAGFVVNLSDSNRTFDCTDAQAF